MSYSHIRQYFNERVQSFDSQLKEWRGALVFEDANNIPTSLLDCRYHIEIGPWASSPAQDTSVQDQFTIILTLFKKGFTEPTEALDNLLDKALCIRHELINPRNVDAFQSGNNSAIEAVENTSGGAQAIDISNDNIIKIALEFNVRLYFCAVS